MDEKQTISFIQQNLRSTDVKSQIVTVTPKVATMLLNMNWKENRIMLDGQHRCWAVLEANKPIETVLVTGVDFDAKSTINCGRSRSLSFLSNIPPARAAALNFILRLAYGNYESTAANLIQVDKVFGESIQALVNLHGSRRMKTFRQAACTAAAALWHHAGNKEYVLKTLRGLLTVDTTSLTPIAKSFLSQSVYQVHSNKSRATGLELFQRAFKVFNPDLGQITRLAIKDGTSEIDTAREMIIKAMDDAGVSLDLKPVAVRKPAKKVAKKKSH